LIFFGENLSYNYQDFQLQQNVLTSSNSQTGQLWDQIYFTIYQANSIIQGLEGTTGVGDSIKNELIGESEFVRAFCDFYLVNLFGNIPLVTTINYQKTSLLSQTPAAEVYQSIITDLKDAQSRLPADYSVAKSQRIIPNKWAATALLARVYLYTADWQDAINQSSSIINNTALYGLAPLNEIFLANSNEAIWQLQQSNVIGPSYNITPEAYFIIPYQLNSFYAPNVYLMNNLLNAFEPGDQRKMAWLDSTSYSGVEYYFPYKYQQGPSVAQDNGSYIEYYMVLRLAEQYLIRAEAEAQSGLQAAAITDLNIIRTRAGLNPYANAPNNQDSVLNAIYHERQIELFAEWGHRWLDLKRDGQAVNTINAEKGLSINSEMLVYPIPASELQADPNLKQSPGY
jgi:hypothetical protein